MKKLLIVIILLFLGGCCHIKMGELSYTRFGPQEINNLTLKTPDGLEVSVESLKNTEATETLSKVKDLLEEVP